MIELLLYVYLVPTAIMWIWCGIEALIDLRDNDTENFMWLVLKVIIGSIPLVNIVYIIYLIKEEVEYHNAYNTKTKM